MTLTLADGTSFLAPADAAGREAAIEALRGLYREWGYQRIEVPALERLDESRPRSGKSFKLVDRDGGVLALRSDFTPALANYVRTNHPAVAAGAAVPLRLSYDGLVWHAIDPELARGREFTQVGIELVGVSNARADAELIHLARESVRLMGLTPRVEVGNPAFVSRLFDAAEVSAEARLALADAIDRKDTSDVLALVARYGLRGKVADALVAVPDLYGDAAVIEQARELAPDGPSAEAVERLAGVVEEFEDPSELMLDFGLARRLSYYTGVTFRVYTFDFGQPLLGGGRYDGALLPRAAGFALGLGRLLAAANGAARQQAAEAELVVSLDDAGARRLRLEGYRVARALVADPNAARAEAVAMGARYLHSGGGLLDLRDGAAGGEEDGGASGDDDGDSSGGDGD
ncbi:MAG TPA: ATP phosphoribosyltransferase regulatory subunit [Trueperaceae bacterium]|nr:ATP phosphoribosyltransferase regulatory subunit [Trueperaceae bacterium]